MTGRQAVIDEAAARLCERPLGRPVRVAVDGVTAAGKTTAADELATAVQRLGRPAIRLSMDGFHHRRAHRHRRGRQSPIGYYEDAYDVSALAEQVLIPLGPDGDRRYRTRVIDLATDQPADEPPRRASADAVVIFDGTFLQRPELAGLWDHVVYVRTSLDEARRRGVARDAAQLGGAEAAGHLYDVRYHAACRHYLDAVDPAAQATMIIENDDPARPVLRADRLFSYGTLRQPDVQLATFGRALDGRPDTLPGHVLSTVRITDPAVVAVSGSAWHPIVTPSTDPADGIEGTVFTISAAELAAADDYEVDAYHRVAVTLAAAAGRAWVYTAATAGRAAPAVPARPSPRR